MSLHKCRLHDFNTFNDDIIHVLSYLVYILQHDFNTVNDDIIHVLSYLVYILQYHC